VQVYAPETELRVGGLAPVDAEEAAAFDSTAAAAGPWRAALHAQVGCLITLAERHQQAEQATCREATSL
jgi:hypothetical protein